MTRRPMPLFAGACLTICLLFAPPADAQAPVPCDSLPGFHALDFWLGEWEVKVGSTLAGTNRIEKTLNGCAVIEHWEGTGGGNGMSLFFYNHATDTWKQVWVTEYATAVGGLKEKTAVAGAPPGALRFQGVVRLRDGREMLDRTTLSAHDGGTVRQVIETSTDGGATWQVRFDAIYARPSP